MMWKVSDSILARGFAVIIVIDEPDFFKRIFLLTPETLVIVSSISGSSRSSLARSEVKRLMVRPNTVSA